MDTCIEHDQLGRHDGYGTAKYRGSTVYLHRLAYCEAKQIPMGDIKGFVIRHTCDNPRCINPQHLLLGTHQDNVDDKMRRGRHTAVAGSAHYRAKLNEEAVLFIREHYKPRCKQYGGVALAEYFGISPQLVSGIIKRTSWKHIE